MTGSNTILMVEDFADIATIYTFMLESSGYKVEVARDGQEALEKTLSLKPDVILLDIMIPKVDGVTVLQTIRTKPEYKDIQPRILIMSNLLQQDIADKAKRYGADGYVVKANMRNMDLVDIVKELLARPKRTPDETMPSEPMTGASTAPTDSTPIASPATVDTTAPANTPTPAPATPTSEANPDAAPSEPLETPPLAPPAQ